MQNAYCSRRAGLGGGGRTRTLQAGSSSSSPRGIAGGEAVASTKDATSTTGSRSPAPYCSRTRAPVSLCPSRRPVGWLSLTTSATSSSSRTHDRAPAAGEPAAAFQQPGSLLTSGCMHASDETVPFRRGDGEFVRRHYVLACVPSMGHRAGRPFSSL